MFNWLKALLEIVMEIEEEVSLSNKRKKYVRLSNSQKDNLIKDRMLYKTKYKELALKYNISITTVNKIINSKNKSIKD